MRPDGASGQECARARALGQRTGPVRAAAPAQEAGGLLRRHAVGGLRADSAPLKRVSSAQNTSRSSGAQSCGQLGHQLAPRGAHLVQPGLAARGELEHDGAAVLGVRGALDQAGVDQRGDLPGDRRGVDAHARRERLDAHRAFLVEPVEQQVRGAVHGVADLADAAEPGLFGTAGEDGDLVLEARRGDRCRRRSSCPSNLGVWAWPGAQFMRWGAGLGDRVRGPGRGAVPALRKPAVSEPVVTAASARPA